MHGKESELKYVEKLKEKNYKKFTITADSGASSHITNDDRRLDKIEIINDPIYDTTGTMIATKK